MKPVGIGCNVETALINNQFDQRVDQVFLVGFKAGTTNGPIKRFLCGKECRYQQFRISTY